MSWRTVVVSQHARVSLSMQTIVVQTEIRTAKVPVADIQVLLIASLQVMISTAAIAALGESGATIIFSGREGQPVAQLLATGNRNLTGKHVLTQANWSRERVERLWTRIVQAKIATEIQVLHYYQIDDTQLQKESELLEINDVTNREAVAAKYYFASLYGNGFNRRDNTDALNAGLNYGYAIVLSAVNREIVADGFITQIGIHHDSDKNYYNLGSDLMEPFRAVIDQWTASQRFVELTPDVKWQLVNLLNVELKYNGKTQLLRNAIGLYVADCMHYLAGESGSIEIEVEIPNEVSSNALNDHV